MKYRGKNVNGHFKATFLADKARQPLSFFFVVRYKTVFDINVHTCMKERGILF